MCPPYLAREKKLWPTLVGWIKIHWPTPEFLRPPPPSSLLKNEYYLIFVYNYNLHQTCYDWDRKQRLVFQQCASPFEDLLSFWVVFQNDFKSMQAERCQCFWFPGHLVVIRGGQPMHRRLNSATFSNLEHCSTECSWIENELWYS